MYRTVYNETGKFLTQYKLDFAFNFLFLKWCIKHEKLQNEIFDMKGVNNGSPANRINKGAV